MPHYKDGTEAKLGDVVKGKGYNIKDENGNPKEIVGIVHDLIPKSSNQGTCDVQVLILTPMSQSEIKSAIDYMGGRGQIPYYMDVIAKKLYHIATEYGQCDHFEKI